VTAGKFEKIEPINDKI